MKRYLTMQYPSTWHGEMWREGAPCGNGTVGALVYGGLQEEIILLNHTSLWKGGLVNEIPDVSASLAEVRAQLDAERPDLANPILRKALEKAGYRTGSAIPLPLGDLRIRRRSQVSHRHYKRVLDMEQAEVSVRWEENGVRFARDTFVSRADGLVYTRIRADKPGMVSVGVTLTAHDTETLGGMKLFGVETTVREDCILYAGDNPDTAYEPAKGAYGIVLRVLTTGGRTEAGSDGIEITDADEVLLVGDVFVGKDRETAFREGMERLVKVPAYEDALRAHAELHRALYDRVDFSVSGDEDRTNEALLLDAFENEMSNELAEKLYAYGRYLLVAGSGERDTLPMHLVGLWNGTYQAFWAIHMFNINFEMIYWNALSGGLPSYLKLALAYVESFMDDFRENARKIYGCRGIFVDSVNTPETGRAVCLADHIINWTGGAGWISQHFYDYYRYTGDEDFLREHALPFMAEAALFYEDFLREGKDGFYEFAPSASPENVSGTVYRRFHTDSGCQCSKNAAMDIGIAHELLSNLLEGSAHTGLYAEKRETWQKMLSKLPPYRYNADGSLKEWADDFYEDHQEHRHQSHMYALFPGHAVTPETPEFDAFVRAEDKRFQEGLSEQSSWSMVFMACVYARMRRGDMAFRALSEITRSCCMNNFFTVHNDWRRMGTVMCLDMRLAPFQIDADAGFPAAVNEMLLGSADGTLVLFPALPDQWETGHLNGVCAVGGHTLSLAWEKHAASVTVSGGSAPADVVCGPGWTFADGSTKKTVDVPCTLTLCRG